MDQLIQLQKQITTASRRTMTTTHRPRGRPVGTGIDDSSRLIQVGHLIASTPDLPPTTAIKALGITDPSTIRRLREKYWEMVDRPRTLELA
jgi:hypothetical protein